MEGQGVAASSTSASTRRGEPGRGTVVADGFGDPATKAEVYDALLGPPSGSSRSARSAVESAGVTWRGIKLFYPNPYEQAGHFDDPVLTWRQVFGRAWVVEGGKQYAIWPAPNVVIVA